MKSNNIPDKLILKVLTNRASNEEKQSFKDWINKSKTNKATFEQIKKIWDNPDFINKYRSIDQQSAWENISQRMVYTQKPKILPQVLKVAAVIAIAYLLGVFTFYLSQKDSHVEQVASNDIVFKVPLGSKSEVQLSDGSTVWLNSGSEIRYPAQFTGNSRDIHLIHGEAYFDIKKNKEAPLTVHTSTINIKVLGTKFNVKSYPEEGLVETTLEEGLIDINKIGSEQTVHLKPNQKAVFVKKEGEILVSDYSLENLSNLKPLQRKEQFVVTENIDTETNTSWKEEKMVFRREKMETLMKKLERWHDVTITIENERLKEERVTGTFDVESIEQALDRLMKSTGQFTYTIEKNNIIIK